MSDLEQLTQIIATCLAQDNERRKNSEAHLKKLREQDLNGYVFAFTSLLKSSPKSDVKVFCVIHLRRLLSDFAEESDGKWDQLHPDNQKLLKDHLIEMLKNDSDVAVRKVLCDTIGDLAATMECLTEERKQNCSEEGTKWNGLMETLWGLLSNGTVAQIEGALRIMGVLFVHCGDSYQKYREELLPVFRQTITHANFNISVSGMEAFSCFMENAQLKKAKIFIELIPLMLEKTVAIAQEDEEHGTAALGAVVDIIDCEPLMFKKHFKMLVKSFKAIVESRAAGGIKGSAVEGLILSVERLSKTYQQDNEALKEVVEAMLLFMIHADEAPDEEWLSPPEGHVFIEDEDESAESALRFCMAGFDRIIQVLPKKTILTLLSQIIMEMVQVNDWRYQHCALMTLSQIGEYIDDLNEFEPIVQFTLNFLQNQHPKVRYAALHCLGQMSDDCKPAFQEKFGRAVLPAILQCYTDSIPRVVHHALNATGNFFEDCPKSIVQNHYNDILEAGLQFIDQGKAYFKTSALLAVGNLAQCMEADFIPLWPRTAEAIFTLLSSTKKEHKSLKGQAIEALCLVGQAVGREEFKKVCQTVIEKMIQVQTNDLGKLDPQCAYLLSSWQRIATVLEDDFVPYLNVVMPSVFKLVDEILASEEEKAQKLLDDDIENEVVAKAIRGKQEGDKKPLFYNVNTSESDDVVVIVQMMTAFAETMKAGYLPYAERTSEILTHLIQNSDNEEIRLKAAEIFPVLITAVNTSTNAGKEAIVKKLNNVYLQILWKAIWKELDPETMKKFVKIMVSVIEKAGRVMDESELHDFNQCILRTLKLSDERKQENAQYYGKQEGDAEGAYEDEEDDDDDNLLEETNKLEEELHIALADLSGALFKVYKELTLPLVKLIYNEILPKVLVPEASVSLTKFGLFLIDDMIEHLGIELIPEEWPHLSQALLKYAVHQHVHVRHAAIYGIGSLGEKSKDTFAGMSDMCMKVLYEGLKMQKKPTDDADEFGSSRDNIVASLGKIIKSQSNHINLKEAVNVWVSNLPLRYDFIEGKVQHELLVDIILESDATLIFGENGENLPKTVQVLAEVLETRGASEGFSKKAAKVIQFLASNEATKTLLQNSISNLDAKLQAKLKKAVEN